MLGKTLEQLKRWVPQSGKTLRYPSLELLRKMKSGESLQFGPTHNPFHHRKQFHVVGTRTYRFGDTSDIHFELQDNHGVLYTLALGEEQGTAYYALSRACSREERNYLFNGEDIKRMMNEPYFRYLSIGQLKAHMQGWLVKGYEKKIHDLRGEKQRNDGEAETVSFHYYLLVSEDEGHALEFEKYADGLFEVFGTVYGLLNDIQLYQTLPTEALVTAQPAEPDNSNENSLAGSALQTLVPSLASGLSLSALPAASPVPAKERAKPPEETETASESSDSHTKLADEKPALPSSDEKILASVIPASAPVIDSAFSTDATKEPVTRNEIKAEETSITEQALLPVSSTASTEPQEEMTESSSSPAKDAISLSSDGELVSKSADSKPVEDKQAELDTEITVNSAVEETESSKVSLPSSASAEDELAREAAELFGLKNSAIVVAPQEKINGSKRAFFDLPSLPPALSAHPHQEKTNGAAPSIHAADASKSEENPDQEKMEPVASEMEAKPLNGNHGIQSPVRNESIRQRLSDAIHSKVVRLKRPRQVQLSIDHSLLRRLFERYPYHSETELLNKFLGLKSIENVRLSFRFEVDEHDLEQFAQKNGIPTHDKFAFESRIYAVLKEKLAVRALNDASETPPLKEDGAQKDSLEVA
jgi:hypothetical protein